MLRYTKMSLFRCYMKKLLLIVAFFIGLAVAHAQDKDGHRKRVVRDSLPYMKYPEMPAFNLRLMDSATILNTFNIPPGQPVALMLFDPGCKHCHDVTTELMKGMDSLKNISFYFITFTDDFKAIRNFYNEFHMADHPNIKAVGRDYELFFIDYYGVNSFPDIALYNENKQIVQLFEGRVTVAQLYEKTHNK